MIEQRAVRTYPENYNITTGNLNGYLKAGYRVVMCNEIYCENGKNCLEYIVERTVRENE
ncbi:MAG: hypothetical protein HFI26_15470 [Lachnospiraceae bacterium]|jgi:hypothetical protein|nr:hypothetical protein [Lachnospiraceae bacterium]